MTDTGAKFPTTDAAVFGGWFNTNLAYSSDNQRAYAVAALISHRWGGFDFSVIPAGSTIVGILVSIENNDNGGADHNVEVELSYDEGTNYTSTGYSYLCDTTVDAVDNVGGAMDTWGRTWSTAELSSTNFQVKLTKGANTLRTNVDAISVTIYYTEGTKASETIQSIIL